VACGDAALLVTKIKQREIVRGLFYWFSQPITVKEKDVDALAGKALDAIYCHLQDYEFWEESKRKQESIGKNIGVKIQMQRVTESPKHKFAMATLLKKEGNTAKLTIIKKERRSLP
jgi:hypothetical protein